MAEARRVVKKPRVKATKPTPEAPTQDPWLGTLDEGDSIEFSVTAEVKNQQGRSFWVKGGAAGHIRPGESPGQAKERVTGFVLALVDEKIAEFIS